jgi:hypothetical protein
MEHICTYHKLLLILQRCVEIAPLKAHKSVKRGLFVADLLLLKLKAIQGANVYS